MPSTWSPVILHCVFSTNDRAPQFDPPMQGRLFAPIGGVTRAEGGCLWKAGGMPDHVHLLAQIGTNHRATPALAPGERIQQ